MNTPYLMICFEMPVAEDDGKNVPAAKQWEHWRDFEAQAKAILARIPKPDVGKLRPAANVLMLPMLEYLRVAIAFLSLSSVQSIPYKIYFLENEPKICA